nr:MAG TPA: hypothetical protein [Caudoviricetes sp.]
MKKPFLVDTPTALIFWYNHQRRFMAPIVLKMYLYLYCVLCVAFLCSM